ncbi:MAG: RNA chaperone Hfq [Christensenellaceae bacterium]|jgi:host factor-I protein|nr:RNA chaperone Hfq [Christensenellaceae bacterium]
MGKNTAGLQDIILNSTRKDRIPVTLHLMNGVPLKGLIRGFDSFVVLLESDGKQQMIYKHAISTVTPSRPVQYNTTPDGEPLDETEE